MAEDSVMSSSSALVVKPKRVSLLLMWQGGRDGTYDDKDRYVFKGVVSFKQRCESHDAEDRQLGGSVIAVLDGGDNDRLLIHIGCTLDDNDEWEIPDIELGDTVRVRRWKVESMMMYTVRWKLLVRGGKDAVPVGVDSNEVIKQAYVVQYTTRHVHSTEEASAADMSSAIASIPRAPRPSNFERLYGFEQLLARGVRAGGKLKVDLLNISPMWNLSGDPTAYVGFVSGQWKYQTHLVFLCRRSRAVFNAVCYNASRMVLGSASIAEWRELRGRSTPEQKEWRRKAFEAAKKKHYIIDIIINSKTDKTAGKIYDNVTRDEVGTYVRHLVNYIYPDKTTTTFSF